ESGAEVVFTTPKMYQMFLKDPVFESTVRRVLAKPSRITIKVGETSRVSGAGTGPAASNPAVSNRGSDDAAAERALGHPEVQRFQELFPDSQVRTVRNLRENEA